jgi:hypothetical protein
VAPLVEPSCWPTAIDRRHNDCAEVRGPRTERGSKTVRRIAVATLLVLSPLSACSGGASPTPADPSAPPRSAVASASAPVSSPSNGREVCATVRAATNVFSDAYDTYDLAGAGNVKVAEAFATKLRAKAALATDADLRISWATGSDAPAED